MNVIIYGSDGFVGRYIVRNLYDKVNLILPARNIKKIQEVFKDLSLINYVQINEDNIQEPIYKFNPDMVINLIGILTETSNQSFEKVHFEITKKLSIKTIAEFVHSKEVFDKVVEMGIDYSQGYYISEPKPNIS